MQNPIRRLVGLASLILLASLEADAQRLMEKLDRGVVAVPNAQGHAVVSWRLLGIDPGAIAFNVYRGSGTEPPVKLNPRPLAGPTFFVDESFQKADGAEYSVRPVVGDAEQKADGSFKVSANAPTGYVSIPLQTPAGYSPNDASVGDLDADGQYEIVLHQTGRAHDNSHHGETDPPILQAYKLDGTLLWTINLGKNIREGAHYTQFMVYDFDGDGRAEVACKTADGTVDGKGKVIGDANANHIDGGGRILRGPEFLTIFDGLTGAELATTKYIPGRHPNTDNPTGDQMKAMWGDGYGNRGDRFLACVAYLDGKLPSLVMCRGYYTRTVLAAWDWRNGKLTSRWVFDAPTGDKFAGQGNHNLSVADVDGDGKDEIIYGGMTVDDNGKGLYSTELGHGDAIHVSDLDPTRRGLEVFRIQEPPWDAGAHLFDAKTGKVLWKKPTRPGSKEGPGRGVAIDIDPRHKGTECWVAGGGVGGLFNAKGSKISDATPHVCNFAVWWDGDFLRETLDKNWIGKWDWKQSKLNAILTAEGCESNNGTKSTPCLSGDILGDWREEVIWRTSDNNEMRIYVTTEPTQYRLFTLTHDSQYRLSIAWQNVGYNQPPHTSFFLGDGMRKPPQPNIRTIPGASAAAR
jgi:rhamnogalacturonan endolyase